MMLGSVEGSSSGSKSRSGELAKKSHMSYSRNSAYEVQKLDAGADVTHRPEQNHYEVHSSSCQSVWETKRT